MASITILNDNRPDNDFDVIAHVEGCQDIARLVKKYPNHIDKVYTAEYATEREAFEDYNADFLAEGGEEAAFQIDFAPCCKLPNS